MSFVSPTRALIWREVHGTLWGKRSLVLLVVWLLCALLVPYALWPEGTMPPSEFSYRARLMIMTLCSVVLIGLALTVPAIAAASVTREREDELIDQLRLTLLTDGGLVRGKVFSSVTFGLLLLVGMFPLFAVVQFIFGLDNRQIAQLLTYLVVFSLTCAMCGVASSTLFRRTILAVAVVYGALAPILLFPAFAVYQYARVFGVAIPMAPQYVWPALRPLSVVTEIVTYGMAPSRFAVACAVPLALSMVLYAVAKRRIARVTEPARVLHEKPVDDQTVLHARRVHFPFYLIDPLRRKPVIADGQNAMVVREVRWGLFNRSTWMVRVFYGTFILFIFPMLGACMNSKSTDCIMVLCFEMAIIAFAAPVLVGSAWTKERELGNIDMIRMTLLRARDLYIGKTAGGLTALSPVIAAIFLTTLPAFIWHYRDYVALLTGCATIVICALIALVLCIHASIMSRRTTSSIATGVIACAMVFFGFSAISTFFVRFSFGYTPADYPFRARYLSPIIAYGANFSDLNNRSASFLFGELTRWAMCQAIFLAFALVITFISIHRLSRREMCDA